MSWYNSDMEDAHFGELVGKTIVEIRGMEEGNSGAVVFICSDGTVYNMEHHQDCCEHVYLEDICGDTRDLLNRPIVYAEESSNSGPTGEYGDSSTWTFYRMATDRGWVVLRWLGSSNGYYGEGVSFERRKTKEDPIPVNDTDSWYESTDWSDSSL